MLLEYQILKYPLAECTIDMVMRMCMPAFNWPPPDFGVRRLEIGNLREGLWAAGGGGGARAIQRSDIISHSQTSRP